MNKMTLKLRHTAVDIDLDGTKLEASILNVFKTSLPSSGGFYIRPNVPYVTWKRKPALQN